MVLYKFFTKKMEQFKPNFEKHHLGDKVISGIFPHEGRKAFSKNVEKTLKWSEQGGPQPGTSLFIRNIIGSISLKLEELSILKQEIDKEIKKIKKAENKKIKSLKNENTSVENKKQILAEEKDAILLQHSRDNLAEELKRSGGIDPNEL